MARNEDDDVELDEDAPDKDDGDDDGEDEVPTGATVIERMTSIEAWEMFRIVDRDAGARIATLGLRTPNAEAEQVAYALWFPEDIDDPGRTGQVARGVGATAWDDGAREAALRKVLSKEQRALSRDPARATFRLGSREAEDPAAAASPPSEDDVG